MSATITTIDGTTTYSDDTAARIISMAVWRNGFLEASMHGHTLRIQDDTHATINAPGTPGLSDPHTISYNDAAAARTAFLSIVEH